jgi:hypothetical protein
VALFSKSDHSSWSAAFQSFTRQFVAMIVLATALMTGAGFYGAHRLTTRSFQSKLVHSSHLLKIGTFPTYAEALDRLARRVPGDLKTFSYSSDTTVWFGKLALFGVAYPDAKGIIKKDQSGFTLFEED